MILQDHLKLITDAACSKVRCMHKHVQMAEALIAAGFKSVDELSSEANREALDKALAAGIDNADKTVGKTTKEKETVLYLISHKPDQGKGATRTEAKKRVDNARARVYKYFNRAKDEAAAAERKRYLRQQCEQDKVQANAQAEVEAAITAQLKAASDAKVALNKQRFSELVDTYQALLGESSCASEAAAAAASEVERAMKVQAALKELREAQQGIDVATIEATIAPQLAREQLLSAEKEKLCASLAQLRDEDSAREASREQVAKEAYDLKLAVGSSDELRQSQIVAMAAKEAAIIKLLAAEQAKIAAARRTLSPFTAPILLDLERAAARVGIIETDPAYACERLLKVVQAGVGKASAKDIAEGEALAAFLAAQAVLAKVRGTKRASDAPAEGAPAAKKQSLTGKFTLSDGLPYAGNYVIRDGAQVPHGNGASSDNGKVVYDGFWFEGLYNGYGCTDLYNGDWVMGKREGQGEAISYDGFTPEYTGSWKDDVYHGMGIMYDEEGFKSFEGEWVDGERHGQGKAFCTDDEWHLNRKTYMVYDGAWEHGKRNGCGKSFLPSGELEYADIWTDDVFVSAVEPVAAAPAVDIAAALAPVLEAASAPVAVSVR